MDKREFLYNRLGWNYEDAISTWEIYKWFLDYCDLTMINFDEEDFENEIIYNLNDLEQIIGEIICEYFEDGNAFDDKLVDNDFYEDLDCHYFITLYSPNVIKIDFSELFNEVIDFAGSYNIEVPKVKENGKILLSILDKLNQKYPFKFTHP